MTTIHHQINSQLRQLVAAEATGARFLSERQVSERFGVSRPTANKILSSLVAEGVLEFRKGIGTFVRPAGQAKSLGYNLRALVSFTDEAIAAGKTPRTEVLAFERDGAEIYVERLRLADEQAVILERRRIVARHCPRLTRKDVAGSLYELWTTRYGLIIAGADETVRAVNLSAPDARLLQTAPRAAGLLISSTGYLPGREPLWTEETLYRGAVYEFHNRL